MVLSKIDHIPNSTDAHGIYFVYTVSNPSITGVYIHAEDGTVQCLGNPCLWEDTSNDIGNVYNWYAVTDPRNIAPIGWHAPSSDEWGTLINFAGSNKTTIAEIAREAARKLVLIGGTLWYNGSLVDSTYTNSLKMNIISTKQYYVEYQAFNNAFVTRFFTTDTAINDTPSYAKCATFIENADEDTAYLTDNKINATYIDTGTNKDVLYANRKDDGLPLRLIKDDSNYVSEVVDMDGNTYPTIKIGNQVWLARNYRCTKYRTGESIGLTFGIDNVGATAIDLSNNLIKPKNDKQISSSIILNNSGGGAS